MVTKDAALRIRVDRNLRDAFLEVCRAQDKPGAQVIREFMRQYVARHARFGQIPTGRHESGPDSPGGALS